MQDYSYAVIIWHNKLEGKGLEFESSAYLVYRCSSCHSIELTQGTYLEARCSTAR